MEAALAQATPAHDAPLAQPSPLAAARHGSEAPTFAGSLAPVSRCCSHGSNRRLEDDVGGANINAHGKKLSRKQRKAAALAKWALLVAAPAKEALAQDAPPAGPESGGTDILPVEDITSILGLDVEAVRRFLLQHEPRPEALNTEAIMGALGLGGAKALSSTSGAASTGTTASGTKPKQREADSALPECIVSPRGLHYLFRCHQCLWEDTEAQGSDDAKAEAQGEGLFRKGPTSGIEAVPEPMLREADSALTERIENPVSLQEKGRGGLGTLLGTVELEPAPGQLAWLCSCCRARSFDLHWERRLCFTPGAH